MLLARRLRIRGKVLHVVHLRGAGGGKLTRPEPPGAVCSDYGRDLPGVDLGFCSSVRGGLDDDHDPEGADPHHVSAAKPRVVLHLAIDRQVPRAHCLNQADALVAGIDHQGMAKTYSGPRQMYVCPGGRAQHHLVAAHRDAIQEAIPLEHGQHALQLRPPLVAC